MTTLGCKDPHCEGAFIVTDDLDYVCDECGLKISGNEWHAYNVETLTNNWYNALTRLNRVKKVLDTCTPQCGEARRVYDAFKAAMSDELEEALKDE